MSFDLLTRRQTPNDLSLHIEDDEGPLSGELLPTAIDVACILAGEVLGPASLALSIMGHIASLEG